MGKRSPLLANKEDAVKALFRYAMQQSGETQRELERQLLSSYQSRNDHRDQEAVSGQQWSRWVNGHTVPEIGVVKVLFDFCVENLIAGKWTENRQEAEWADLLVAVSDQRTVSLSRHRSALKLAYSSLNAPSVITKEKIRGIEAGYYMPSAEEIERLFFTKMLNTEANAMQRTDRAITFNDEAEENALQAMLKEIETNYGQNAQDKVRLAKFFGKWGLIDDGTDWSEQLLLRMQKDVTMLFEITERLSSLDGGLGTTMEEVQIGDRIKQEAVKLQKIIDSVSVAGSEQRAVWKNELHFFNVKRQGLDGTQEFRYLSVVEVPEIDYAGRHARDLHPHLFVPIL